MTEIDQVRARLETAGELSTLLRAAGEAFSLLLAACCNCEGRATELFAAFAFASAAAAEGRLIIASAPSWPNDLGSQISYGGSADGNPEQIADVLAGLAAVLGQRLSAAGRQAHGPGARAACQDAAAQAAQINQLLALDEP